MTYLVVLAFIAIGISLAAALYFMIKGGNQEGENPSRGMAKALAFRIGFSILLFLCVLIAWKLGYLKPTGIPGGR